MIYVAMSRIERTGSALPQLACQLDKTLVELAYWVDWLDRGYSNLLFVSGALLHRGGTHLLQV